MNSERAATSALAEAYAAYDRSKSFELLRAMPIGRVRDVTSGNLRIAAIEDAGYRTVADVRRASVPELMQIRGVGELTARQVVAAAAKLEESVAKGRAIRIDMEPGVPGATELLRAIRRADVVLSGVEPLRRPAAAMDAQARQLLTESRRAGSRVRMAISSRGKRDESMEAVAGLARWRDYLHDPTFENALNLARAAVATPDLPPALLWDDFRRNSARYYTVLRRSLNLGDDLAASKGFLPKEIAARVANQQLDTSLLRTGLRGYQEFGAKYALVQRRTMLGDEMGLGKTLQAISAMAHLTAGGATHFVVVCPASVLVNWLREIEKHSELRGHRLHGPAKAAAGRAWVREGGVAVTTFESLRGGVVPLHVEPALIVVDEAHYVKNPDAQRSRAVAQMIRGRARVLFLTGTPMENRVDEFRSLVDYLQPAVALSLQPAASAAGADAFRRAVAPVYLRRNQTDVLTELPELIQIEEWVDHSPDDEAAYRSAVLSRNFMAMRQAAYAVPSHSAKMERLKDLVQEARQDGRNVVVFSYFRSVLNAVADELGEAAIGPLTGSVSNANRQAMVDELTDSRTPRVLVAQIEAGGVGLNIQAASVAILCEPQLKPTAEAQAIARLHRMGQVDVVQAHRLLAEDSVDERLLQILAGKRGQFDTYARPSSVADASPEAVDISDAEVARRIVDEEFRRITGEAA